MRTIIVDVDAEGKELQLELTAGRTSGQAVLVLSDAVRLAATDGEHSPVEPASDQETGFPPRHLTEEVIVQVLRENGGKIRIRDKKSGWNIYDEVAARLGVSMEARQRPTPGTGEAAWRPEVGWARKNLEQAGVILSTEQSGRGVWKLAEAAEVKKGVCPDCGGHPTEVTEIGVWDGLDERGVETGGAIYEAVCSECGETLQSHGSYDARPEEILWTLSD